MVLSKYELDLSTKKLIYGKITDRHGDLQRPIYSIMAKGSPIGPIRFSLIHKSRSQPNTENACNNFNVFNYYYMQWDAARSIVGGDMNMIIGKKPVDGKVDSCSFTWNDIDITCLNQKCYSDNLLNWLIDWTYVYSGGELYKRSSFAVSSSELWLSGIADWHPLIVSEIGSYTNVPIKGDLSYHGGVDIQDVIILVKALFDLKLQNVQMDLDDNGVVDLLDFLKLAYDFFN